MAGQAPAAPSSGHGWASWVVIGTASTVAVTGLAYLAWSRWSSGDDDQVGPGPSKEDAAVSARLRIARGIQMRTLAEARLQEPPRAPAAAAPGGRVGPSLPVRTTQSRSSGAGPSAARPANGSAAGPTTAPVRSTPKSCSHCATPCAGLPLRCSACKTAFYCSQECQRLAWPEHKASCKASKASSPAFKASKGSPAAPQPQPSAPVVDDTAQPRAPAADAEALPAAGPSASNGHPAGDATPPKAPGSFQEALAAYLEEKAASQGDSLEGTFQTAVMLFVKGEFRAAMDKFHNVQALAAEQGKLEEQGEAYKWLGHAHNRLGEKGPARTAFEAGIEFAASHNLPRVEIDCLGGLGTLLRTQGDTAESVRLLERALAVCDRIGDTDSKAATLSSLGMALTSVNVAQSLVHLQEAVDIREAAIERMTLAGERSGLATAVMEHANALISLAEALVIAKRAADAEAAYLRALEVFELIEDVEKVAAVLGKLANLEAQSDADDVRQRTAQYRVKLLDFLKGHGMQRDTSACAVCTQRIAMREVTPSAAQRLIVLPCLHCLHHGCWKGRAAAEALPTCPTCHQVVAQTPALA